MIDVYKILKKYTSFDLIITNSTGQQITFKTCVEDTLDDKILAVYPVCENQEFNSFKEYEKFMAIFCTEDGVLSGNVNLLQKNVDDKKSIFISFPYNNQFCQRRENTRIPMHVDVDFHLINKTITLKTKNISGKGIACLTDEAMPDFYNTEIILHMPSGNLSIICRKVYSKEMDLENKRVFLNGIAFTEISDDDVNIIVKDCLKFQLDSRHNERLFETI